MTEVNISMKSYELHYSKFKGLTPNHLSESGNEKWERAITAKLVSDFESRKQTIIVQFI
jgi:hypothetical protein